MEDLLQALRENRIIPYFQPIFDLRRRTVDQHEALVRLIQKNGLVLTPMAFLSQAKEEGLHSEITKCVLEKSLAVFEGTKDKFSINLSPDDLSNKETLRYIKNLLPKYQAHDQVIFEVVESDNEENFDAAKAFILDFTNEGYQVSIDDFGSGYLTLNHLENLPISYLKVDGYLIKSIFEEDAQLEVKSILDFCKERNIKVVAERIENEELYQACQALGFNFFQGYHLGKPSPQPTDPDTFF